MAMRGIARHGRRRPKALICRSFCRPWDASEGVSKPCRSPGIACGLLPTRHGPWDASGGRSLWVIIIKIWYKIVSGPGGRAGRFGNWLLGWRAGLNSMILFANGVYNSRPCGFDSCAGQKYFNGSPR